MFWGIDIVLIFSFQKKKKFKKTVEHSDCDSFFNVKAYLQRIAQSNHPE